MNWVYRCMVVRAEDVVVARTIAEGISPVSGAGMWNVPVSPDGNAPATHYWDAGSIGPEWGPMLPLKTYEYVDEEWVVTSTYPGDSAMLWAACQQYGVQVTQQQILDLFAHADVTAQEPAEALSRLGLKLVASTEI